MGGMNHQKSLWAAELWPELLLVKLLSSTFALKNALYMPRNAIESLY